MTDMVAIVTGSSRGLGRAIAKEYAREGASVVVCARSQSPAPLPGTIYETAQAIQRAGGDALAVPCDVTNETQVENLVQQTLDRYGRIDVLVNNAGIMIIGESFLDIEPARWDEIVAVNLRGSYLTCRYVLPTMIEQGGGASLVSGLWLAASQDRLGPLIVVPKRRCTCLASAWPRM